MDGVPGGARRMYSKYLGHLRVTFDPSGNVISSFGKPILLDNSVPRGDMDIAVVAALRHRETEVHPAVEEGRIKILTRPQG
ncbi:hypothetical protein DPEC_G00083320 [Dallia pectoralis]|uniref:Uncharacterized protein n=1 Tax=Dallia pectoralis TaxID=75939 RepID=A0ACC2GYS9_DALPE|nr:hypothetical protein DPEC_G00083320 [Dallia pectoralis]